MRNYLFYFLYASAFLLYVFLTLPLLLPNNATDFKADNYDAIIVLGGGVTTDCALDPSMQARMDTAIELFHQHNSAKIILTGGPQGLRGRCVESEAMRQFAIANNIGEEAILKESLALNTYQNAFHVTRLMEQKGLTNALIVTSDYHTKRANFVFKQYEFPFQMVAAPSKAVGVRKYKELFKEQVLLCFHTVFGVPNRFGLDLKEQKLAAVLKSLAQS